MKNLTFGIVVLTVLVGLSAGCSRPEPQSAIHAGGAGVPVNYLASGNGRVVGVVKPLCAEFEPCSATVESQPMPEIWLEFSDDSSNRSERAAMRVDLPATAVEILQNYWKASMRHRDQVVINRAADADDFQQKTAELFRVGSITRTRLGDETITSPDGPRKLSHSEIGELIRFLSSGANDLAHSAAARN